MRSFSFLKPARRKIHPVVEEQLIVCSRESKHWQNRAEKESKVAETTKIRFRTDQLLINKWSRTLSSRKKCSWKKLPFGQGQGQENVSGRKRSADFLNIANDPIIPSVGVFLPYGLRIVTISGFISGSGSMGRHFHTWIGHHTVQNFTPTGVFGMCERRPGTGVQLFRHQYEIFERI